jgi:hypothetical protein
MMLLAALASQGLDPVHATVFRRFEGHGYVIQVAGVGMRKGNKIVMWNPDGKLDPGVQAAVDTHIQGTSRQPGQPSATNKTRLVYFQIWYPPRAGFTYFTFDPAGNPRQTDFLSVYCNHELVEVNFDPTTKRTSAYSNMWLMSNERAVMPFRVGSSVAGKGSEQYPRQAHL